VLHLAISIVTGKMHFVHQDKDKENPLERALLACAWIEP